MRISTIRRCFEWVASLWITEVNLAPWERFSTLRYYPAAKWSMSEHNVYLRHFDLVQKPICNIMNGISSKHGCWSVAYGPYNSCVYYILWNPERISYCGIIFARNWKANAWITKKFVAGSMETNQLDIGVPIVWCCFLCLFLPFERKNKIRFVFSEQQHSFKTFIYANRFGRSLFYEIHFAEYATHIQF